MEADAARRTADEGGTARDAERAQLSGASERGGHARHEIEAAAIAGAVIRHARAHAAAIAAEIDAAVQLFALLVAYRAGFIGLAAITTILVAAVVTASLLIAAF